MPKGEPTKVVRLPVWLCELIEPDALRAGVTLPAYITRRLAPRSTVVGTVRSDGEGGSISMGGRCTCKAPTLSKVVTNLCTACKRMR